MIEKVYSSKETEELSEVRVPKNIRQIGDNNSPRKIYIEDYVMTSLKKNTEDENGIKYGVLLGDIKRSKGNTYIFVRGLVETREVIENSVIFNDDIWAMLYKDIKKYFEGVDIVGWFVSVPYTVKNDMSSIQKIHLDNFAGNDKVCYLNDRTEHEDGFFVYDTGNMQRQSGYYVFYEKNEKMKRYLKQTQGNRSVSVSTSESLAMMVEATPSKSGPLQEATKTEGAKLAERKSEMQKLGGAKANAVRVSGSTDKVDASVSKSKLSKDQVDGVDKKVEKKIAEKREEQQQVQMTFRDVIKKQVDEEQSKGFKMSNFAYGISSILIIALLLSTVVMLNNYGELKSLKASIENMSGADSVEAVNEILSSIMPIAVDSESISGESGVNTANTTEETGIETNSEVSVDNVDSSETAQYDMQESEQNNVQDSGQEIEQSDLQSGVAENNSEPDVQLEARNHSDEEEADATPFSGMYHTVTDGQTLYDISISYYGDSSMVERIKEINSIDDDYMIQEGQELLLP